MKMTITLLKDLDTPEGYFKAGQVIEVEENIYDWLQASYLEERQALAEVLKTLEPKRKDK